VDSLFAATPYPNIVVMGDFNDYPTNASLLEVLRAKPLRDSISSKELYNLMYKMHAEGKGSNKHLGEWGALDQLIVSGNLLNPHAKFFTTQNDVHFFEADFLLEDDNAFLGKQPLRTYVGMKYQGGFSDHLPIYADFCYERNP
jgi:endonuclease/exonuclease/phosphatase family metal-dependent hydrolase